MENKKAYLSKVRKEIENIKKFATKEELSRLNIKSLEPSSRFDCIYGQMTGSCFSTRARDLIISCCNTKTSFDSFTHYIIINVKPRTNNTYSYLEHFIFNYRDNNANIISYLKGEIDKLKLKM